jgi:hypothetical protein
MPHPTIWTVYSPEGEWMASTRHPICAALVVASQRGGSTIRHRGTTVYQSPTTPGPRPELDSIAALCLDTKAERDADDAGWLAALSLRLRRTEARRKHKRQPTA